MSLPADSADEAAIRALTDAQQRAMITGDTQALNDLMTDDCTLTHISGYKQSKEEWLSQIDAGQMHYHDYRQEEWTVNVDGERATVTSRMILDATIYGTRHDWPLQMTSHLIKIDDHWLILDSVATTF